MVDLQASVSKGWLNKNGGYKFESQYYLDPLFRHEQDKAINDFLKNRLPDYPIYNMEDNLMQAKFMASNQVIVGGLQPNLILGMILGSEPLFPEDKDSDIVGKPLENITSADELPSTDSILNSDLIKKIDLQIQTIQKTHYELNPIPPFFWDLSGRATIHGIVTTSHKLVGENIFMMMVTDPGLVHAIHSWITEAYIKLINHFSEFCSLKTTSIHIGECSGPMLSPAFFDEFVTPYINILGEKYNKVRLHSCGKSDNLIESFSKIKRLQSIDVGSGTNIKLIRKRLGNDIDISTFPAPDILMEGSPIENIHNWIDNILESNQTGNLKISYHIEPGYNLNNCLEIHEYLKEKYKIVHKRLF